MIHSSKPQLSFELGANHLHAVARVDQIRTDTLIHPTTGGRRALGFEQPGAGRPWRSSSMRDEEWADGWADITDTTQGDSK